MMPKNFKQILHKGGKGKKISFHSLFGLVRSRNFSSSAVNQYHSETSQLVTNSCKSGALGLDEITGSLGTNMKPIPSVKGSDLSQMRHFSSAVNQSRTETTNPVSQDFFSALGGKVFSSSDVNHYQTINQSRRDALLLDIKHRRRAALQSEFRKDSLSGQDFLCAHGEKPLSSSAVYQSDTETVDLVWFNSLFHKLLKMKKYPCIVNQYKQLMASAVFQPDIYTINMVINSMCRLNQVDLGFSMLAVTLKRGISPDACTYNTLIKGLGKQRRIQEAIFLFDKMKDQGIEPNVFTFNTLIHEIHQSGKWEDAQRFFCCMVDSGISPTVANYNTLISSLGKHGRIQEAFFLFTMMIERGMRPVLDTFTSLVSASCNSDIVRFSTAFDALCDAGKTSQALNALKEMIHRGIIVDRTAVVTANTETEVVMT